MHRIYPAGLISYRMSGVTMQLINLTILWTAVSMVIKKLADKPQPSGQTGSMTGRIENLSLNWGQIKMTTFLDTLQCIFLVE